MTKRDGAFFGAGFVTALVSLVALGAAVAKKERSTPAPDAPRTSAAPPSDPARDDVVPTIPLELGEGDDRNGTAKMTDLRGDRPTSLPYGTRIERLKELSSGPKGHGRVRVLSGPREGLTGWVPEYQIQAAR